MWDALTVHRSRIRDRFRSAVAEDRLMVLRRRSDGGERHSGYVLALGSKWVLLARVTDGGFFDGHMAFRLRDLRDVRDNTTFESRAAQLRVEWPPRMPGALAGIDLNRTAGVLDAFGADGSLIGLQSDHRSDVIWIGTLDEVRRHWVYLWEVDSVGEWGDRPLGQRLRRLTVVERGGQYLRGLAEVAGAAPPR